MDGQEMEPHEPVPPIPRPKVRPLSAERYGVQFTVDGNEHEVLQLRKDVTSRLGPRPSTSHAMG
jgi:hypothetical protein